MFRVKVSLVNEQGNLREITTICKSKSEVLRRVAMYEERYPEADVYSEELSDEIPAKK